MSAIGILGGLAAAGAAYKEGQRNRAREARQQKYDDALAELRTAQAERIRSSNKPPAPDVVVVKEGVADMSTLGMPGMDYPKEPDEKARGGMVGYANGGMVGHDNVPAGERMSYGRVCDFVDSNWQKQSFKK